MEERIRFINIVLEGIKSFTDICKEFDISTKTGYKWLNRFKQEGYAGLEDHSRRPLTHSSQLDEDVVCDLIAIKLDRPRFGPKKILELYTRIHKSNIPSLSSVNRVLKRAGLVTKRKKRISSTTGRITNSVEVKEPNDLWTIDFKGWWISKDQHRIEPLTVRDAFSRYVLAAKALSGTDTNSVKQALINIFNEYGLPQVIQSDNGSPFAAKSNVQGISRLSAWLISLGILIHRSRPGHPQDNGGHERMHRDLKESVQVRFRGNAKQYQAELDMWREEFNEIRPHEALKMKTPAEIYHKSNRKYYQSTKEVEYPTDYLIRKVSHSGCIKIDSFALFISTALQGYWVGLKVLDSQHYAVYFASVFLGKINVNTLSFKPLSLSEDND